jgi:hypothetical protein
MMNNEERWWRKKGAMIRFSPIESGFTLKEISKMLPALAESGINVIEILPPYYGGSEYGGLDIIDFYKVHPDVGTVEEMRELIVLAHKLGLMTIACLNIGYCSVDHPVFIKACNDVKNNILSRKRNFFLWSKQPHKLDDPLKPFFLQDADGEWAYSEIAGQYYWCKWFGTQGDVRLPQYWFRSADFQEECVRMVRFWRRAGFDGFMVDAVNWYADCNWEINRKVITDPALSDGPAWLQPEGAGGFDDDPLPWITLGGYNCVQDYAMGIWWKKTDLIREAIEKEDASAIIPALMRCRNRVVEAGGVTYVGLGQGRHKEPPPSYTVFETGLLIAAGEMISYYQGALFTGIPSRVSELFHLQAAFPALAPGGKREYPVHNCDGSALVIRCIPETLSGNIIFAIFNFSHLTCTVRLLEYHLVCELRHRSFVFIKESGEELFRE